MNASILLLIASLFYLAVIIILYFSKERIKLLENKVFSIILIVDFIGILLDIIGIYAHLNLPSNSIFRYLIVEFYYIYLLLYMMLFTLYTIFTAYSAKKILTTKLKDKIILIFLILLIIFSFISYILPFDYYNSDNYVYVYGLNSYFVYLVSAVCIFISLIYIIKYSKYLTKKKTIPFIMLICIGVPVVLIQYIHPYLLLVTSLLTAITILMYFTIENPDLQMLREFHKARELAKESNKEKTEFLFNISNQIKTPINKIIETSEKALNENDVIEIKNDVRTIKGKSNSLLNLVNNVLDISDEEMRQIEIRGSKYNVKRLFEIINKKYEKITKVEYRFKYDNSIPEYLYGDSMRIRQIMNILLENAVEYTNVGYIETSVNCIIKNNICRLVITVEDSGIGMDTEEIKHLFDKEKIYENELLKEIDDTKNNLSMLKSIVNLMNGNVLVESNIGVGSKFTIIIDQKIIEEKTKIIKTVEEYEEMYEQNKKIIIVTDREEISKKIKKILKKESYEIEEVTLGQTCLERMRKGNEYDLIIIDEEIPKLSSEDTMKKIKDTKCYKKPVILITKNKGFGSREMYQEKGFKDIIIEPIKKEEVINIVKEYIDK